MPLSIHMHQPDGMTKVSRRSCDKAQRNKMKNLLGELMGTNGHGDRQNCGHGNRDATNEQHQEVVDPLTVWAMLDRVHDKNFNNDAYGN